MVWSESKTVQEAAHGPPRCGPGRRTLCVWSPSQQVAAELRGTWLGWLGFRPPGTLESPGSTRQRAPTNFLPDRPVLMACEDETALVKQCLEGNARAFETLVHRYYKVLFNCAYRMVSDVEDARDITQSTFLKAYEKLKTFDPRHKFFSWVYRIMVNESLNLLGRRKPHQPLDAALVSPRSRPDEDHERRRQGEAVQAALMHLSPEHRQVIVLRHYAELSYREMSWVLGIPEKTVKSRLFSARRQLSTILVSRGART